MSLTPGSRIGPYEVTAPIGAGGMGEVYRAIDTNLKRQVAIKVLPDAVAADPERLARFQREAQVLAALNHPHIAAIYGLERGSDQTALIMELVEGPTLADRIAQGPIPADEAIALATQIASAIEAAHELGIVHRDLKPANIKVRADGTVKVLDFGLAKALEPIAAPDHARGHGDHLAFLSHSPTITSPAMMTGAGVILGTAAYMSPEQARGKPVDTRADIWAFGAVLFEMLTASRAFPGEDVTTTLAAIIHTEPNWSLLPAAIPASLSMYLRRCLQKDPKQRIPHIAIMRLALEGALDVPIPQGPAFGAGWTRLALVGAVSLLLGGLAVATLYRPSTVVRLPNLTLTLVPPADPPLVPVGDLVGDPEISPDGTAVLYFAGDAVYVRRLDSLDAVRVPGSESASNKAFWSADSSSVFYPSVRVGGLMRVRLPDGAPERVMSFGEYSRGGSENGAGTILMSLQDRLRWSSTRDGEAKLLDVPGLDKGWIYYPEFLPDGESFLFFYVPPGGTSGEEYLASFKDGKVGEPVLLLKNDSAARYTPAGGGHLLFVRRNNLYSQKLDLSARTLVGDSQLVTERVGSSPVLSISLADFSVSRSGTLAWRPGVAAFSQVTTFDRQGHVVGTTGPPLAATDLRLAPDETRLLAVGDRTWLLDVDQRNALDLGSDPIWMFWSADASKLVGINNDLTQLVERSVSSATATRVLGKSGGLPVDLTVNGSHVLLWNSDTIAWQPVISAGVSPDIQRGDGLFGQTGRVSGQSFSPDGKWVVYRAGSGLFVQPFRGPGSRRQVATFEGVNEGRGWNAAPRWRADGREILFFAEPDTIFSIQVDDLNGQLRFTTPRPLFKGARYPAGATSASTPLAVTRDGSRIYWPQAAEQPGSDVIHVRTNAVQ